MTVTVAEVSGHQVVTLAGEVDIATSPRLRQRLDLLGDAGSRHLVLDFSAVTLCDSTGLGVVVSLLKRVIGEGGSLKLAGLRPNIAKVFDVAGMTDMIPTFPSVAAALAAPGPSATSGPGGDPRGD
ncbi:MAG: STAS domain-containing protein [Carbonactinosporaceae bacterium]